MGYFPTNVLVENFNLLVSSWQIEISPLLPRLEKCFWSPPGKTHYSPWKNPSDAHAHFCTDQVFSNLFAHATLILSIKCTISRQLNYVAVAIKLYK